MKLRTAVTADVDELVRIATQAIALSGLTDEQVVAWGHECNSKIVLEALTAQSVLLVEQDHTILGFINLVERGDTAGEIKFFYVDPAFARRGVGKLLIRAIEDAARQQEMSAVWVDATELGAHRLLQLGYRVHDEYKKSIDNVLFRGTWMLKRFT